jgi:hypothetical protein
MDKKTFGFRDHEGNEDSAEIASESRFQEGGTNKHKEKKCLSES